MQPVPADITVPCTSDRGDAGLLSDEDRNAMMGLVLGEGTQSPATKPRRVVESTEVKNAEKIDESIDLDDRLNPDYDIDINAVFEHAAEVDEESHQLDEAALARAQEAAQLDIIDLLI